MKKKIKVRKVKDFHFQSENLKKKNEKSGEKTHQKVDSQQAPENSIFHGFQAVYILGLRFFFEIK